MATVIMVTVIIEATTDNATLNTLDLHTGNPAPMENLLANPTKENLMANLTTMENHTANLTTMENHTANPKLAMVNPPMDITRSFLG